MFSLITLSSCNNGKGQSAETFVFTTEILHKTTPVKNQGHSNACWAYAMLSMIESEHLAYGDSVNLSPAYIERMRMRDEATQYYFAGGRHRFITRGTGMTLIHALMRYGIMPYDSYPDNTDVSDAAVGRRLSVAGNTAIHNKAELMNWQNKMDKILDDTYGPLPRNVYMLGAQYTPLEFAHSVCQEDEYTALTSFTHHPFFQPFELEIPDNWEHDEFLNVPIDQLVIMVVRALKNGHTAVWEGDTSEQGFSFRRGVAVWEDDKPANQTERQREFERLETSDNHAMHIIGLAKDQRGEKYFILKNSWGTDNPYHGLMYMSEAYFRMKTIAVFMPGKCVG